MNIISRIKSAMFQKVIQYSMPHGSIDFMKRHGKEPKVDKATLVKRYWGYVYSCAGLSASGVCATPIKLYASRATGQAVVKNYATKKVDKQKSKWLKKRIGKSLPNVGGAEDFEELEEHPLLDLLQNVNEQENSYEMKELTSIMLDLTGDAYWYLEPGKLGIPERMFVLRSQWVKIIPDERNFVSGYLYGAEGQMQPMRIEARDVIHFKYPNPNDPWYGIGPVQAAAYTVEESYQREMFMIATMANMGRPDLVVKYVEGELDTKERQMLEREWNQLFKGAKNAGKVKVTDYRYEMEKIGWTPQELRFDQGEEWIMKKICAAFPVPIGLIDTAQISRAPRSGMEGADLFMAKFNTLPRITRIEEKLNEQLCPRYDDRLFLAFDNPVPRDEIRQLNEDNTRLANYSTTINEVREREGEEPVEWGNVPLTQPGIAPLGSAPQEEGEAGSAGMAMDNQDDTGLQLDDGSSGGDSPLVKLVKGTAGQGITWEVDGGYVHTTLSGIPLRLKPIRNEGGQYTRMGPRRLRLLDDGDGEAVRRVFGMKQ